MTPIEPGVLDANVLAYAINTSAPQHLVSRALLDSAGDHRVTLYVSSQILCEFYSIITNPRRVASPKSAADAQQIVNDILALPGLWVLPMPISAVAVWLQLLRRYPVIGADVFDLQIVATMLANGINRIYTFNCDDFRMIPEITVIVP